MNLLSRSMLLVIAAFPLARCASLPDPVTRAPNNPASPSASEGRIHKLELFAPAETAMPAAEEVYTCLMHPHIAEVKPGKCPICGMPLVKKPKEEK